MNAGLIGQQERSRQRLCGLGPCRGGLTVCRLETTFRVRSRVFCGLMIHRWAIKIPHRTGGERA